MLSNVGFRAFANVRMGEKKLVYPDYSQHELGLLAGHVLFTPLWISDLINIPLIRSRNTIPTVEISLWLFGISSLSEHLGNPNVIFNFRGIESDWQSWRTLNELVGLCAQLRSRNEPCRPVCNVVLKKYKV